MKYIFQPFRNNFEGSNDKSAGYAFYDPVNKESIAYEGGLTSQMQYGLPGTL